MRKTLLSLLLAAAMLLTLTGCGAGQPQEPSVWKVRFELNGGELVSGELMQRVTDGQAAQAPEVRREGYSFSGWSLPFDAVSDDLLTVARWEKDPEPSAPPAVYTVFFELNGAELVSGELMQRVIEGQAAQAPEVMREGYSFSGWSLPFDAVSDDLLTVAQWEKDPEPSAEPASYEVRFEMNGGEFVSGRLLQHIPEGGSAEAPLLRREGYALKGWSESFEDIRENLITAALWVPLYSVRFDADGGTITKGSAEQQVAEGENPVPPEVERRGYSFDGWSPEPAPVDGETSYTARWKPIRLSSSGVFDKISPAVVEIEADMVDGEYYSLGSGFFIDDEGTVVTNFHVIDESVSGIARLQDGTTVEILSVLAYDPLIDLAVLKTDITGNPFLLLSETPVKTGDTIYALGSSEGLTSTFSSGIVSTASREIEDVRYIQITAPISHGNSGGPLVNEFGEVVGVNTMGYIEGQNLNFAVDIHELEKLEEQEPMSLLDVYNSLYGEDAPPSSGWTDPSSGGVGNGSDDSMYPYADAAEQESNNSFLISDPIENGMSLAGELSSTEDLDWFYIELDSPKLVSFLVVPSYYDDADYLTCSVMRLTAEHDVELVDKLSREATDDYSCLYGEFRLEKAGVYFLLVCMDESYPYPDPLYYLIETDW